MDPYGFFVSGIGYRFYCIFTIFFVMAVAMTGRDFGPMRRAEQLAQNRASEASGPQEEGGSAWLAVLPMLALIGTAMGYLYQSGVAGIEADVAQGTLPPGSYGLTDIFGAADGYQAMFVASIVSVGLAGVLALVASRAGVRDILGGAFEGMGKMFGALLVLVLAWSLASAIGELDAGTYLAGLIDGNLPVVLFPTVVFLVSAVTAFATGTSFGTMGILVPTVVFLSFQMSDDPILHYAASGAVLSGACWGDHCSPISDTTVLSSLGTGCGHIEHVRTQLPYALVCGLISVFLGSLPVMLGLSLWACLLLGIVTCWGFVRVVGREVA
jgi:Na+/H+ antiporter NhaC